jgi:hypothetical protein
MRASRSALIHDTEARNQARSFQETCEAHEHLPPMQPLGRTAQIRRIPRRLSLPNARGDTSPITVQYL